MARGIPITVGRSYTIQVCERHLLPPLPGSAEPRHTHVPIFTTRANVTTRGGASEFAAVDINGRKVTHTFAIRFTTLTPDVRHVVRDARGQLYQILAVENKNNVDREYLLHCANQGDETQEAAR